MTFLCTFLGGPQDGLEKFCDIAHLSDLAAEHPTYIPTAIDFTRMESEWRHQRGAA